MSRWGRHPSRIAILRCVITHRRPGRVLFTLGVTLGTAGSLVVGTVAPALADTPSGWARQPHVSALDYLLVLLIIPLGLALVITLLTLIPSFARGRGYEPGQSWHGQSDWFGGPQKGVAAADDVTPERLEAAGKGTGGGSGRW